MRAFLTTDPGLPDPQAVPQHLLRKYAARGPRYTSYPTAPHFRPDVDRAAIAERWAGSNNDSPRRDLSFYLHIPFCRERCWFCGCHVVIRQNREVAQPYVDALVREMDAAARLMDESRVVRQLAFGGGTPTFLEPEQLGFLVGSIRSRWPLAPDAELSIEVDPRTVTLEQIDELLTRGFNRFSLGVQDFDEQVLAMVHRPQGREVTERVVTHLRRRGTTAINFDLIYGLPGQTVENSAHTLAATLEMRPSRIALYHYAHVPWLKPHQKLLEKAGLPDAELKLRIFSQAYTLLTAAGYVAVGMDHFALPEDEMTSALLNRTLHRNFMGYSTRRGLDLVALGVSGITSVAATYAQNTKELPTYYTAVAEGAHAWECGFLLSRDDQLRRELIIDLFCNFHLDTGAFSRRWGLDFSRTFEAEMQALRAFEADGLLEVGDRAIAVTPVGRYFIRNICMTFDRYLEPSAERRRYSATL